MPGIIGRKVGMTNVYGPEGENIACTVIEAGPCIVTQVKNVETDGELSATGLPDKDGVLIVHVGTGTLAEKSGLSAGDVIRKINGKPVVNMEEMLNTLQVVMWQGSAEANILHNQQAKDVKLRLK